MSQWSATTTTSLSRRKNAASVTMPDTARSTVSRVSPECIPNIPSRSPKSRTYSIQRIFRTMNATHASTRPICPLP